MGSSLSLSHRSQVHPFGLVLRTWVCNAIQFFLTDKYEEGLVKRLLAKWADCMCYSPLGQAIRASPPPHERSVFSREILGIIEWETPHTQAPSSLLYNSKTRFRGIYLFEQWMLLFALNCLRMLPVVMKSSRNVSAFRKCNTKKLLRRTQSARNVFFFSPNECSDSMNTVYINSWSKFRTLG